MVKVLQQCTKDPQDMRKVYCDTLIDLAKKDPTIVAIDCDLTSSMGMKPFAEALPRQHFDVGIAESNGVGIAGGMSSAGLKPFVHTFAAFATRRVYDQIFLSCAYAGQNVKIIGGDSGITTTYNGGTHMSFEDLGIMRIMPGVTVLEPTDSVMLKSLIEWMADHKGVVYMRLPRKNTVRVYEEGSEFTPGKGVVLREGNDVTIITHGICVSEALLAAELLQQDGIEAKVIDMFTIKPIDKELIVSSAKQTGLIVTVENHNIIGGLGSAVAEVLAENCPVPLLRHGIRDEFGEVGSYDYLQERFRLRASDFVQTVKQAMKMKTK